MKRAPENLVRRMLDGDASSFDEIVASYSHDVFRLCHSLLWDEDESQDALQEALLRLVRAVREGKFQRANGSVKGFLTTCARNLCIDRLRKRATFYAHSDGLHELGMRQHSTRTPDVAAQEAQVQTAFTDGLSQLTDLQRTILVLHDLNGETFETIAETLRLNIGNVRTHLCRARKTMRELLEPIVSDA